MANLVQLLYVILRKPQIYASSADFINASARDVYTNYILIIDLIKKK